MTIDNGNSFTDLPTDSDLAAAIAQSMAKALHGDTQKAVVAQPNLEPASWLAFASTLDRLVSSNPELKRAVEEAMARSARQALAFGDGPLPSTEEFLAALRNPPALGKGGTNARGYWWGFQLRVSHEDLNIFLATAVPLTAITATLIATLAPVAAAFVGAVAGFIAGMLALLKALDRGSGVYISMSWFAAGVFVPTSA